MVFQWYFAESSSVLDGIYGLWCFVNSLDGRFDAFWVVVSVCFR